MVPFLSPDPVEDPDEDEPELDEPESDEEDDFDEEDDESEEPGPEEPEEPESADDPDFESGLAPDGSLSFPLARAVAVRAVAAVGAVEAGSLEHDAHGREHLGSRPPHAVQTVSGSSVNFCTTSTCSPHSVQVYS